MVEQRVMHACTQHYHHTFLARSANLPEGLYILPMFFLYLFFIYFFFNGGLSSQRS